MAPQGGTVNPSTDLEKQYRTVCEIISILTTDLPVEKVVHGIGTQLQHLIPCDRFSLGMSLLRRWYILENGRITVNVFDNQGPTPEQSASGWVMHYRTPLLRPDIAEKQRFNHDSTLLRQGIRSDLIVPILADGNVVGTFNFTSRQPNRYDQTHLEAARAVAGTLSMAVKHLQDRMEIEAIRSISSAVQESLDLDQTLQIILGHVRSQGYDRVRIYLYDPETNALEGGVQSGLTPGTDSQDETIPIDADPYSLKTLAGNAPCIYRSDPSRHSTWLGRLVHPSAKSVEWAEIPLKIHEKDHEVVVGKIALDNAVTGAPLRQERLDRLMLYASQAAVAIRQAQLHRHMARQVDLRTLELQQQSRRQEALLRISRAVQQLMCPDDFESVVRTCSEQLHELGVNFSGLILHRLIDEGTGTFESCEILATGKFQRNLGPRPDLYRVWYSAGAVYRRDLSADVEDLDAEILTQISRRYDHPIRSILDFPQQNGILTLFSAQPGAFTKIDITFIEQVSDVVSLGISRVEDLERAEKMQWELVRLERLRALEEMAQGVAHNFNNLLVGMLGYAQLIQMKTTDPQILKDSEAIVTSALRAKKLVKSIEYSVRKEETDTGPVEVLQTIQEAVEITRPRWKDESETRGISIRIHTETEADLPPILGTRTGLRNILINLLSNAIDALPSGGDIRISAGGDGDAIRLTVTDTGIGMDEPTRQRVFEPFFSTKADVGTGLGLSTVYGAVTRWGGDIQVESAPGRGTVFTLLLPCWHPSEDEPGASQPSARERRANLLVVEDEEIVRILIEKLLIQNHNVETAVDGPQALNAFEPGRYDVALIDLGIPEIPGDQVARRMREADPALVTILITGWQLRNDDPRLADFDFWLSKPFEQPHNISDTVTHALDLHDARAAQNL